MKTEQLEQLNKRNKLIVILIWGCLLLGVAVNISAPPVLKSLLFIAFPIMVFCSVLTWRKWLVRYIKYFATIGVSVICYFFMDSASNPVNMIIMLVGLSIISLYIDYKPLIFNGVISFSILNYFIATKDTYVNVNPPGVNSFFFIIVTVLATQSILGNKMMNSIKSKVLEAEQAKQEVSTVLHTVTESVDVLSQATSTLSHNTSSTDTISRELYHSFHEIASGIEQQAKSANGIADAMSKLNEAISEASNASLEMKKMSVHTDAITNEGKREVYALDQKMSEVINVVNKSTNVMQRMNEQNQRIEEIVSFIVNIAGQTNLLSLNASIEAARAGEQGKGFAVVSQEIRKLAQNSQSASAEIAEILSNTQTSIMEISALVNEIQHDVQASKKGTEDISSLLNTIQQNTSAVMLQAERTSTMNEDMTNSSSIVLHEINSVANITEQTSAAVEQILASSEMQQEHMHNAVHNVDELNKLTDKLMAVINK